MINATKFDATGKEIGQIELSETLFNAECKNPEALLYEVINMYHANQRLGTSKTKGRSEKAGSGRKLFPQKGLGRARMGNVRTPLRVGGGPAFGPTPKNWYTKIPKKKKRLALKLALTSKAKENKISIVEDIVMEKPATKKAIEILKNMNIDSKTLFVIKDNDANIIKSFSNIDFINMDRADGLFAYEVMNAKNIVFTASALEKSMEVFK